MEKEIKEIKKVPDDASIKNACNNGKLQAIGKVVTAWKVTTYTDGTEKKEAVSYVVHARDVLDKEEMSSFRKGVKAIVNLDTLQGVKNLLELFDVATDNAEPARNYLERLFVTTLKSGNGIATRSQTFKEDSIIPVLQMAERGRFETTRFVRKPKKEATLTKEELDYLEI